LAPAGGESAGEQAEVDAGPPLETPAAEAPAPASDGDTAAASGPLREVSLKVEHGSGSTIHLKFTERRGEVHVVTRTADTDLARELADGLPGLRQSLEDAGMAADVWASPGEPQPVRDKPRPESRAGTGSDGRSGFQSDQQGRGGESRSGRDAAKWVDLIEDSLDEVSRGGSR
jgi:hypothetical protein